MSCGHWEGLTWYQRVGSPSLFINEMAISVWGPGPSPYKPHTHSHTAFTIVGHGQLCQLFPCLRFACFEDLIDSYVILCVLCTVSKVNLRMRKSDLIGLAWHFLSRLKTNSSFKKWLFIYMDFLKSTVSAYTNVRCVTARTIKMIATIVGL